jgi:3',5'-cyclic AMP phosphodiesterase CpdA
LPPPAFAAAIPPFEEGGRFAVVGDLQRTSLLEFWREQNDAERSLVVGGIARARPAFVAIAGDLTFDGSSAAKWAEFDALTAPLRDAAIPVIAALGNHEYWGGRAGEPRFFARFPRLEERHWYTVAYGPLRLVVLDSNIDDLTPAAWARQVRWFEATLAELDRDPEVRGALVLLHHPPFTNSSVTGDELHVQRFFVPPLLRARKSLALLSGHVHSYERFSRSGKMFVVTGGGGGPRAELRTGGDRRHPDDLFSGPALRDFNFVLFTVSGAGLAAEVMGLSKGGTSFSPIDRFSLPFPP